MYLLNVMGIFSSHRGRRIFVPLCQKLQNYIWHIYHTFANNLNCIDHRILWWCVEV